MGFWCQCGSKIKDSDTQYISETLKNIGYQGNPDICLQCLDIILQTDIQIVKDETSSVHYPDFAKLHRRR